MKENQENFQKIAQMRDNVPQTPQSLLVYKDSNSTDTANIQVSKWLFIGM